MSYELDLQDPDTKEAVDRICDCFGGLVEDGYEVMFVNEIAMAMIRQSMELTVGLETAIETDRIFRENWGWEQKRAMH